MQKIVGRVIWTCYAESRDGVRWEKPNLGLVSYKASTGNNILGGKKDLFNLSVIIDPNERPGASAMGPIWPHGFTQRKSVRLRTRRGGVELAR